MASGTNPFLLDIPDEWNSGLPLELSSISMHYAISENKRFLYRNPNRLDLVRSYKFFMERKPKLSPAQLRAPSTCLG